MAGLIAAVVGLSVAVAVNFLILLAVVRRLRLQRPTPLAAPVPPVGMQAPTFALEDYGEQPIDDSFYQSGTALVAFLTENCDACERAKVDLVRDPVVEPLLVFVQANGSPNQAAQLAEVLAATGARVAILESDEDLPARFAVKVFPTFLRILNGVVEASSVKLADVRRAASATSGLA